MDNYKILHQEAVGRINVLNARVAELEAELEQAKNQAAKDEAEYQEFKARYGKHLERFLIELDGEVIRRGFGDIIQEYIDEDYARQCESCHY